MSRLFRSVIPTALAILLASTLGCDPPSPSLPDAGPTDDGGVADDGGISDDGGTDDGEPPLPDPAGVCEACAVAEDCAPELECVELEEGVTACLQPCVLDNPDCEEGYTCALNEEETAAFCFPTDGLCCVGETEESFGTGVHCEIPDCSEVEEGATETCGVGACERTVEVCVGDVPQKCAPGQPLLDGDGNPFELCNGIDDDCDGEIDNAPELECGLGICARTVPACVDGADNTCLPGEPLRDGEGNPTEVCNGLDDDCNGLVDDMGSITCGLGVCERTVELCVDGEEQECVPGDPLTDEHGNPIEVCNGLDDDCNGEVDDGLGEKTCGTGECTRTVPFCVAGEEQDCVPGEPTEEVCDGRDNSCSGEVDDMGTQTCGVGACLRETLVCDNGVDGVCIPGDPVTETCNGIDDDCNGLVDDGLPVINCGTGRCARTDSCVDGEYQACTPGEPLKDDNGNPIELCNGIDDNCDGEVDNNPVDAGTACATGLLGECSAGTNTCVGGALVCQQNKQPQAETCNGRDDDCDGAIDNDPVDAGTACNTGQLGECAQGRTVCSGGGLSCQQLKQPVAEQCSGRDDDCNGVIDDLPMLTCGIGECFRTVPACVNGTNNVCVPGNPAAEVCDGKDNNCDGVVDNITYPSGRPACTVANAQGICAEGEEHCIDGQTACIGPAPQPEVCDGRDNNCDGQVDNVGMSGTSCQTGLHGICAVGTLSCDSSAGNLTCNQNQTATSEVCNGLDDNCDGQVDNAAWNQLCPPPPNVDRTNCVSGDCTFSDAQCAANWYNVDGIYSNGCECLDEARPNTCSTAIDVTRALPAAGGPWETPVGKVISSGSADWYRFTFAQSGRPGVGHPRIDFSLNQNDRFRFQVYLNDCNVLAACGAGTQANGLTEYSFSDTGSTFAQNSVSWPTNVYVKVTRLGGGLSCESYRLRIQR